jgi:hypothetical protein
LCHKQARILPQVGNHARRMQGFSASVECRASVQVSNAGLQCKASVQMPGALQLEVGAGNHGELALPRNMGAFVKVVKTI